MKLNKKGFTLIELLGVIVILVIISSIAISSISSAIERNKVKQNDAKKAVIVSIAELYYQEHKNSLPPSGSISTSDPGLKLSEAEKTDVDGNFIVGCITYTNGADFKFSTSCS